MSNSFDINKFFKTPKGYVLAILLGLTIFSQIFSPDSKGVITTILSIVTCVIIDVIVSLIQRRKRIFPDGAIITGLIVGIILSSTTAWYVTVLTAGIADLSKHLLKNKRKPLFNPAAFGLTISAYLLHSGQSWWGALTMLPTFLLVLMIIAGFYMTDRINKFPTVLSFVGFTTLLFFILSFLTNNSLVADSFRNPIINSTLFLAFFMLTDPPTSPAKAKEQILFGLITALLGVVFYLTIGGLCYQLIALLIANLWSYYVSKQKNNQKGQVA